MSFTRWSAEGGARELGADIHHGFEQLAGRILELIYGDTTRCHAAWAFKRTTSEGDMVEAELSS